MKTLFTIATLALLLSCALGQTGPYSYLVKTEHANVLTIAACKPGEYLSVDGRCLHDQTGEGHPAGDNCNSCSCVDAACHFVSCTAMFCLRGDDPAPTIPDHTFTLPEGTQPYDGGIVGTAINMSDVTTTGAAGWNDSITLGSEEYTSVLQSSGPSWLEISDKSGVILTAFRDGSVVAKDPSKIDAIAKKFWKALAEAIPAFCSIGKDTK